MMNTVSCTDLEFLYHPSQIAFSLFDIALKSSKIVDWRKYY